MVRVPSGSNTTQSYSWVELPLWRPLTEGRAEEDFSNLPLVLLMYLIIWGQCCPHTQHVSVLPMELWQLCNTGLRFIAYSLTQHNLKQCILKLPGGPHWWGTETLQVGRKKWLKCWWHNCTLIDWFFELCVIWHHWFCVILKHDVTWSPRHLRCISSRLLLGWWGQLGPERSSLVQNGKWPKKVWEPEAGIYMI